MFYVENILRTRYPKLSLKRPRTYQTMVTLLRFLCKESEFHYFAKRYPDLKGIDFVSKVLDYFRFTTAATDAGLAKVPPWGRLVIIANHPIGSLDGLALLKMISEIRPDVKIVANNVLSYLDPLKELLLPVDNMGGKTSLESFRAIERHLQSEGAIIVFPSGEVSRMSPKGIRDGRWQAGFLHFAMRTRSPIMPICIDAHNSIFFYGLSMIAKPVSTIWLVREMFKHTNRTVRMHIGHPINYETYQKLPTDNRLRARLFKLHLYKVGKGKCAHYFQTDLETIAPAEDRQVLRGNLAQCEKIGDIKGNLDIYLYTHQEDCAVMREIGRLRELSFRAVGEGTGKSRDLDEYDPHYQHLILWSDEDQEIVGAYRLRHLNSIAKDYPPIESAQNNEPKSDATEQTTANEHRCYSQTLFHFLPASHAMTQQGVELGRSFVQPKYWRQNGLDLLWRGIGTYICSQSEVRYLVGPVSISNRFPPHGRDLLVSFYSHFFPDKERWIESIRPFQPKLERIPKWTDMSYSEGLTELKSIFTQMGLSIPPLYKQYTELCEPGGVRFSAFSVDPDFANCVDGFVIVDLVGLKPNRKKRYFNEYSLQPL